MSHGHYELNARNLLCPLPVIRTQDRIKQLQPGDQLIVTCTDPGALSDIPAWCRINGPRVIDSSSHRIENHATEHAITIEVGC